MFFDERVRDGNRATSNDCVCVLVFVLCGFVICLCETTGGLTVSRGPHVRPHAASLFLSVRSMSKSVKKQTLESFYFFNLVSTSQFQSLASTSGS